MKIKKINAVLGLLVMLVLLCHAGIMSVSLYTGWYNFSICKMFAKLTLAIFILHILLSLIILFFRHDGADVSVYKRANIRLIVQRASALCLIAFVHFHMKAYAHMATGEVLSPVKAIVILIMEILFISFVLIHVAASFSKAFITLGILTSPEKARIMDRIVFVLLGIAGVIAIVGVTRFFIGGII